MHSVEATYCRPDHPLSIGNAPAQETYPALNLELEDVNQVGSVYPKRQFALHRIRENILYYIAGWLLSRALSPMMRHKALVELCKSFVNSHAYHSQGDFLAAAPEGMNGIEQETVRRNFEWQGNSTF